MLIAWIYLILRGNDFRKILANHASNHQLFFLAIGGLLLFKFFSIFASQNAFFSAKGFFNELLSVYAVFAITLTVAEDRRDVKKLLLVILFAFSIACALGVIETILKRNLFLGIFEVDSDYTKQVLMEKIRAGSYRIQSTFSHPLTFSEFIVVSTPFILALLLGDRFSWLKSTLLVALIGIAGFSVLKSGSRSGVGGFLISIGGCAVLMTLRQMLTSKDAVKAGVHLLTLIILCCISLVAVYAISDLLIGKTTRELNSGLVRLDMWRHGLQLAMDQPVFGYGQDMAGITLGFVEGDGNVTIDSYYLTVLLESGFLSLVMYFYLIVHLGWTAFSFGLRNKEGGVLPLAIGVAITCFAVMKSILSLPHNHGIFMAIFSLIFVLEQTNREFTGRKNLD